MEEKIQPKWSRDVGGLKGCGTIDPFLFIQKLWLISSALDKNKHGDLFSEGKASHPVGCDSPLKIVREVWRTFFYKKFELPVSGLAACCWQYGCLAQFILKKVHLTAITICSGLSHPTRSLSRIVCRGRSAPKAVKALWGLISSTILDLGFL